MFICKHEVQYYETDRMGITHHSNYVRWMEEARTFFLREIGWPYEKIEEEGIISPVTSISCDYKATSTFADVISIEINVKSVKSAKLSFVYHMVNQNGVLVCTAASEHSFLSKNGGFVNLKRDYPSFFNLFKRAFKLCNKKEENHFDFLLRLKTKSSEVILLGIFLALKEYNKRKRYLMRCSYVSQRKS